MANGDYTSIRQFDNFVRLAHFERAEQCGMNGHCTHQFVIESDGSVYPCDFYCTDEYLLGNISDKDFFTLEHTNKAVEFIKESLVVDETCKSCEYYMLCKGGCKRERRDVEKCKAYKTFSDSPCLISKTCHNGLRFITHKVSSSAVFGNML